MKKIYSLGVMTGTSCDGADLAVLSFPSDQKGEETLEYAASRKFPAGLRKKLRAAQSGQLNIQSSAKLAREYSLWIAKLCNAQLKHWRLPRASVLIAVHGQTIWHEPDNHISVQLVDAAVIAAKTSCTVTAAFRQPDLARGGQGAPLVPYYHWLRANSIREFSEALPFAIHNVGGVANLTYITRNSHKMIAFDTGPGNALIDLAVEKITRGRRHFDSGGKLAAQAINEINWRVIDQLGKHEYLKRRPPKSTGRELFNEAFLSKLPGKGAALVANATAFTAHTMARAYADFVLKGDRKLNGIFVAGGGAKNPTLLALFSRELSRCLGAGMFISALPPNFAPPQFLEAMAFARLGLEALQGKPVSLSSVTGASENSIGAGIFPGQNYLGLVRGLFASDSSF